MSSPVVGSCVPSSSPRAELSRALHRAMPPTLLPSTFSAGGRQYLSGRLRLLRQWGLLSGSHGQLETGAGGREDRGGKGRGPPHVSVQRQHMAGAQSSPPPPSYSYTGLTGRARASWVAPLVYPLPAVLLEGSKTAEALPKQWGSGAEGVLTA